MKKIDFIEAKRLASLSALDFSEEELNSFIPEFENILDMVEQIKNCDTENVELIYPLHKLEELREDMSKSGLSQDEVLVNSPKSKKGCFAVPQMLED